jgi:hypothetical protein
VAATEIPRATFAPNTCPPLRSSAVHRGPGDATFLPINAPFRRNEAVHDASPERFCKPEVTGSIPVRSTIISRGGF